MIRPQPWLAPAGLAFGAAAALRRSAHQRGLMRTRRLAGPVISVGSLSAGGSGKTPMAAYVAGTLRDGRHPVSILSRGYGGSFRGEALLVADRERLLAGAGEAGDEPVMLARSLPGVVVAVGRRRDRVGRLVEARFGPCVHVLDDGFQHLRLHRDLDLVCLRDRDLRDRPLPAGWLREFPSAVAAAGLVLIEREEGGPAASPVRVHPDRLFTWRRVAGGFHDAEGRPAAAPARPFLLAGIARPERFAADAGRLCPGWTGSWFFPDHHAYAPEEVRAVEARARAAGADALLTTAKDAVRLPATDPPLRVLEVRAEVDDAARFRRRLLEVAGGRP